MRVARNIIIVSTKACRAGIRQLIRRSQRVHIKAHTITASVKVCQAKGYRPIRLHQNR